ncbi:MAG: SGNH/GDSL hydrolase family protein [Lachnospiraceae bacterium]|nr:SGNH/GDSL hydrolase family protein [Lachnospiraceae bacterium]
MEDKNRRGKDYNGRVILYAIMAGFCILALIEIIYGRLQTQAQYEQKVMQENNDLQTEKYLQSDSEKSESVDIPDIPLQGMPENVNDDEGDVEDENGEDESDTENQTNNHDMQIVFLGDSILDHVREYDGVAYLISQACNADVYNMSIGGTTAALLTDEQFDYNNWNSYSLLGVVHAILGDIDEEMFKQQRAGEILKVCDFSKTDYFFIEYGLNDFLAKIPNSQYDSEGELRNIDAVHTYVGALEAAIESLHNAFPSAKIILASPHYCQFFNGDAYIGDSYSLDYGYGPMIDYSELCGYVYNNNKDKNVIYYNTIMDSGIDAYSADDYLEDGIHLTAAGRHAYANSAARLINADFRKNE